MEVFRRRLLRSLPLVVAIAINSACSKLAFESPGLTVAPRVTFHENRALERYSLPFGEAWSPAKSHVVVHGPPGYCVLDATRPLEKPRPIHLNLWVRSVSWSPDGTWLLFVIGEPSPRDERSLVAASADGSVLDTLVRHSPLWPALWGSNGFIYYWTGATAHRMDPPKRWHPAPDFRALSRTSLVVAIDTSELGLRRFVPGEPDSQRLLAHVSDSHQLLMDALPDGEHFLVHVTGGSKPHALVLNGQGIMRADLDSMGITFEPTSLSADGSLVIGNIEEQEGETLSGSKVYLASLSEGWKVQVAGIRAGWRCRFARVGRWLAYEDPVEGGVHIGTLEITP